VQEEERAVPALAVVVIARNEEPFIAQTLESVLGVASALGGAEVVLVDSRSTDRTVEIARRYPVRVVRLRDGIPTTAALGRLVGERLTQSEFVLFVDGDTEVDAAWVEACLDLLRSRPEVGGVGGRLRERHYRDGRVVSESPDVFGMTSQVPEEVDQLGGNAIYRRAALDAVGSFNPYVVSYEEAELAERLRRAGQVVVRLPVEVGVHHHLGTPGVAEVARRFRENLIVGYGQVLRLGLRDGLFCTHAKRMKRPLQFAAFVTAGVISALLALVRGDATPVVLWGAAACAAFLVLAVKSRSLTKPLVLFVDWTVWLGPALVGFVRRPADPHAFRVESVVAEDEGC
jgi:glycosyltransferase involved in cell wall biosynthesis